MNSTFVVPIWYCLKHNVTGGNIRLKGHGRAWYKGTPGSILLVGNGP